MLQIPESESELIQTASIKDQPIDLSGRIPVGPFPYKEPGNTDQKLNKIWQNKLF